LNRLRAYAAVNGTQFTAAHEPGKDYLTFITYPIYNTSSIVALRKGFVGNQVVTVLSNVGSSRNSTVQTQFTLNATGTGFQPGQNITEILSCETVNTDENGNLDVDLHDGGPRVYYPTDSLNPYAGLCGHGKAETATPGNSSSSNNSSSPPKKSRAPLQTAASAMTNLISFVLIGVLVAVGVSF
jgi:alpha-amylase